MKIKKTLLSILLLVGLLLISSPAYAYKYSWYYYVDPEYGFQYDLGYTTTENSVSLYLKGSPSIYFSCRYGYPADTINKTYNASWSGNYPLLMTGLQPNRTYTNNLYIYWLFSDTYINAYKSFTTEVTAATNPTFTEIKGNQVTVNWTKSINYSDPSYKLYIGPSVTGPWTVTYIGMDTTAVATGLNSDTTYYFFVEAIGINGVTKNSGITSVTTGADPATAAAQAAQGAAESAMAASELAKNTSLETQAQIQQLRAELTADTIKPEIMDFSPVVSKVTLTKLSSINYNLVALDNKTALLQYRYKVNDGLYSGWTSLDSETIAIHVGASVGIKKITIQVKDDSNNIASKNSIIFKI